MITQVLQILRSIKTYSSSILFSVLWRCYAYFLELKLKPGLLIKVYYNEKSYPGGMYPILHLLKNYE